MSIDKREVKRLGLAIAALSEKVRMAATGRSGMSPHGKEHLLSIADCLLEFSRKIPTLKLVDEASAAACFSGIDQLSSLLRNRTRLIVADLLDKAQHLCNLLEHLPEAFITPPPVLPEETLFSIDQEPDSETFDKDTLVEPDGLPDTDVLDDLYSETPPFYAGASDDEPAPPSPPSVSKAPGKSRFSRMHPLPAPYLSIDQLWRSVTAFSDSPKPETLYSPSPGSSTGDDNPAPRTGSRFADFTFYPVEQSAPLEQGHALQNEREYRLEVAVRVNPVGIPVDAEHREPIAEPGQKREVSIMVALQADGFDFREPVATLTLPAEGDSTQNAWFELSPKRESQGTSNMAEIKVRLYYKFNLIEVALISAEVVGKFDDPARPPSGRAQPLSFTQERIERDYLDLVDVKPRVMHIDIDQVAGGFEFTFLFANTSPEAKGNEIAFTAPVRLSPDELESMLVDIRKELYAVVMSERYSRQLNGDEDELIDILRTLAEAGQRLWTRLFKHDSSGALFAIGLWLEENPVEKGGTIQVSCAPGVAKSFVFPWSFVFDRELPEKTYERVPLDGFWGLRYCIEQQVPKQNNSGGDRPAGVDDPLQLAFILYGGFGNVEQQKEAFSDFQRRSSGKLKVSEPLIEKAEDGMRIMKNEKPALLYFYTHGYSHCYKTDIGIDRDMQRFIAKYEQLPRDAEARKTFKLLYDTLNGHAETDKSWIEPTKEKIYLDQLYGRITQFKARPFVFLNMCSSAPLTPSLSKSFVHFFLNRGARSVLGTECPMTIYFADPFGRRVMNGILNGRPVGEVLREARRYFLEKHRNPLGLAYTLYGSAMYQLEKSVLSE